MGGQGKGRGPSARILEDLLCCSHGRELVLFPSGIRWAHVISKLDVFKTVIRLFVTGGV